MADEHPNPPEPPDGYIGKKAVDLGLITALQLRDVLLELSQAGTREPQVGPLLVSKGLLTQQQLGVLSDLANGAPPKRIGKYHIIKELGRGGMGVVYEAEDPELGRRVALKMLLTGFNAPLQEQAVEEERFIREARLSANLPKHPHIVGVYEAGVADDRRFIAMEFIEGRQFSEWRLKGSAALRQQIAVLRDVALAVDHAHRHGVVHRDLKPANILVDPENHPHVTDFGLAKRGTNQATFALTVSGEIMGTPAYMSPEQAEGKKGVDPRTDIWALGVMLYEILTGRLPFEADTPLKMIMKTAKEAVPPPSTVLRGAARSAVDRTIEGICMKALSKDPKGRHPSARSLADDLTRWIKGEKATVRVVPKKPAKTWWFLGAAAAALAVIAAATALSGPSAAELAPERAREFVLQGQRLLNQEKHSEALIRFGQALAEDPANRAAAAGKKEAEERMLAAAKKPEAAPPAAPSPGPPPQEDPARKEREAAAAAASRREVYSKELAELDTTVGSLREAESFGAARTLLAHAWKRHDEAEWTGAAGARVDDLGKNVDALYAKLKTEVLESKRRGDRAAVEAQCGRLARWQWPGLAKDLDEALAKITPNPAPTPTPAPTPAPAPGPLAPPPPIDPAPVKIAELAPILGHQNAINMMAFSPDGKSILTSCYDKTVRLWDLATRAERRKLSEGETGASVAVSPDGRWLAAGMFDSRIKLWDSAKFQQRILTGHGNQVMGLAFTPDSKLLVSASTDGTARVWDLVTGAQKAHLEGHPAGACSAAVSPNGRLLAIGSGEQLIKLWELSSGREVRRFEIGGNNSSIASAFLPDGKSVVSGDKRGNVTLWEVETGRSRLLGAHSKDIRGIAVTPDGRWAAAVSVEGLRLYDAASGAVRMSVTGDGFFSVAISRKGDLLGAGAGNWSLRIWDISALSASKPGGK
jgi:predicted Ser/Thr protein kinase